MHGKARDQRLRQTRQIVDRINLRLDPFRLDNGKPESILKNDLALFRNQIDGRREIVGVDAFLQKCGYLLIQNGLIFGVLNHS